MAEPVKQYEDRLAKARQKAVHAAFELADAVNHNDMYPSSGGSMSADYFMDLFTEALDEYAELKK